MFINRLSQQPRFSLISQPEPEPTPAAFVVFPLAAGMFLGSWAAQQWIYHRALEEARAVVRPSIIERDLLGVWN